MHFSMAFVHAPPAPPGPAFFGRPNALVALTSALSCSSLHPLSRTTCASTTCAGVVSWRRIGSPTGVSSLGSDRAVIFFTGRAFFLGVGMAGEEEEGRGGGVATLAPVLDVRDRGPERGDYVPERARRAGRTRNPARPARPVELSLPARARDEICDVAPRSGVFVVPFSFPRFARPT